jgi:putative sigma-54 modulation protein
MKARQKANHGPGGKMAVEFTARQVKISKIMKDGATEGIERIALVLGKVTSAKLTFWAERHLQVVEITLQSRHHGIVSKGEADTQESALRKALAHAELQAQRFRDKVRTKKRLPKVAPTAEERKPRKTARVALEARAIADPDESMNGNGKHNGNGAASNGHKPATVRAPGKQAKAAITVHSFPGKPAVVEPHILVASEALAIRPMRIDEAVKEAEFRDRDLLIFRDPVGDLFVLHRRRDGKMELVEVPE